MIEVSRRLRLIVWIATLVSFGVQVSGGVRRQTESLDSELEIELELDIVSESLDFAPVELDFDAIKFLF